MIICCFIPLSLELLLWIVTLPSLLFINTLMNYILLFPWSPARCKTMLSSNVLGTVRLQPFHHVKSQQCSSHWILIPCMLWTVSDDHQRSTLLLEFVRCHHKLALRRNYVFFPGYTRALSSSDKLKNEINMVKKNPKTHYPSLYASKFFWSRQISFPCHC